MPDTQKTGKILRGCRAFWLSFDGENHTLLGRDSDDLSIENNPDTETFKNVLGETTVNHNGYTPSLDHEYMARWDDHIYPYIQKINDRLLTDDESIMATLTVATLTDEVKDSVTKTLTGTGWQNKVKVSVNSDGGGTAGYSLPFKMEESGGRTQGTVSVTNKVPTFTPESEVETVSVQSNKSGGSLSD